MSYNLHYFVGKICTVLVDPVANIPESASDYYSQMTAYTVGRIEEITDKGIWLGQLNSNQKTFWFKEHVRGIAEEKVLDLEKDAAEIQQLKQAASPPEKVKPPANPYVDPVKLKELADQFNKQVTNRTATGT